ncbi:hypothetical protein [Thalassotalea sp. PS06]|uniref:hypothetical protein n=1 Tax=Thalassotalea sp. PS06 TaxID=2594005 RepID=UPI0011637BC7|nr:hypothetical protein [Thalassotalea sp. PS06]QDP00799.1 hypothetical protein FNC98_05195 [Thalassotalea sp. PS06]
MTKLTTTILGLMVATLAVSTSVQAKNEKSQKLPKGLEKKVSQGKELPPGWQKKLAPGYILSKDVYRYRDIVVPVDKHGIVTVKIDGKIIRLIEASREIVEILN